MEQRTNISTGAVWEDIVGYSRAVSIGNLIEISGTTAVNGDLVIGKDDLYAQTRFILEKIQETLLKTNASMEDVIRTRMFVTDITRWEEAAKAHSEFFSAIRPAASMIQVSRLIHDDLLIEIEVTAVRNSGSAIL